MLAVTIGVGRCASLAIEAANRCRHFTGLDVVILNEATSNGTALPNRTT